MKRHIILLLSVLLFSAGCIHKIGYLNGDVKQIPVVNCLFTNDSVFKVYVGLSSEIFTNQNTKIENASVKIIANNSDTIYFHKINDYLYQSDRVDMSSMHKLLKNL